MRATTQAIIAFAWLSLLPAAAYGQASIAGVVKDTSGAVLPGVTVEAASPALIEKTRSVVTDGAGQYKIIDLRPGTYTVTFTLTGFNTVKREGIELSGAFVASVNADMKVGALEETITVTGESPIVDVQGVAQQRVLGKDVIDAIPTSRTHFSIATMIPAVRTNNGADTGGTNSIELVFLTSHGGRVTDQRVTLDGLSFNSAEGAGQYSAYTPNIASSHEMTVDFAGGGAEMETGGVRVNVVPKEGGNKFSGTMFWSGTHNKLQANNFTDELKARGLPSAYSIHKLWDINPGFGGPIVQDRLWFYAALRYNGENTYSGALGNANVGNPNEWLYVANPNDKSENYHRQHSLNIRGTWQIDAKNKLGVFFDKQSRCVCPRALSPTEMVESGTEFDYPWADVNMITWSSPLTNRLLFEGGVLRHPEQWHNPADHHAANGGIGPLENLIQVTNLSNGMNYHGRSGLVTNDMTTWRFRGSMSYVTGSHAFKIGFTDQHARRDWLNRAPTQNLAYQFVGSVPNRLVEYSFPDLVQAKIGMDLGVYAQDRWTVKKLTANLGVRYDHLDTYYPEQTLGPTTYFPNRNIPFAKIDWVNWNDVTPRLGLAYDVFGNGKTAVKVGLNKYMLAFGLQGMFGDGSNPLNLIPQNTVRTWNDSFYPVGDPRRGNYVPDCDLTSRLANAECGPMLNDKFGTALPSARVDPAILHGWGSRGYNWEFSSGVQHQVTQRISLDVEYFRRWYGNFIAIDNVATTIDDYTKFSITAPLDSRLPNGGGYVIDNLYDLNPNKVGQVDTLYTFASNYGKQIEHWNGVDIGINTRFGNGAILQGGVSTGRTVTDNCAVVGKSPEIISGVFATTTTAQQTFSVSPGNSPVGYNALQLGRCHQDSKFLAQYKGFGSYVIPKVDVQVSANFQSFNALGAAGGFDAIPSNVPAQYLVQNAAALPTLGRNLSAAPATVNLLAPGAVLGDRVNQVDISVAKLLRFGQTKATLKMDLFNAFNRSAVLTENANFAAWRAPLTIMQGRFAKLGVQFDF